MKNFVMLLCFVALSSLVKAQIDPVLAERLQHVLDEKVASAGDHGVSAHLILENGDVWSGTAGVDGASMPMTDSTVFIGASTSKMSISIVLLSMAEDSIISLDDSWHKYLPFLNVDFDTNITIRQLLNHTYGIADYLEVPANWPYVTSNFSYFFTPQYILENIVSGIPDFPAGTDFNYSNSNFCLAAYIAEMATPLPLATELRNRVWNPAGMQHTYFGAYEPINDPRAGVWWNFNISGLTNYSNVSDTAMLSFGYGTDNVVTCPTDLAKLVHALLHHQLLNEQSMSEMLSFVPQSYLNTWTGPYGLGIHHLLGQTVDTLLGHDGKFCNLSDVFHSQMCGFTLACMTNTETVFEQIYNPLYDVLRNYYQCNAVPVANFYTSQQFSCPDVSISFSDSSTNMHPTSWLWSFPGATLNPGSSLTDSMPLVSYALPGSYSVSLTASTLAGSNTITKNDYIVINPITPSYNSTYSEGFETASLPGTDWTSGSSAGQDWEVTANGAATGSKSAFIDNFTNTAGNSSYIISPNFDLSGFGDPRLSFKMAYQQKDAGNADKLQVFTSTLCKNNWVRRWIRSGSALATVTTPGSSPLVPTPDQFAEFSVNIGAVASSSTVRFKFEFTADPAGPGNNIFIDDIHVYDASFGIPPEEDNSGLEIYPNPTTGTLRVSSELSMDELLVRDVLGRLVYSSRAGERVFSFVIDGPGLYFVEVRCGGKVEMRKVVRR